MIVYTNSRGRLPLDELVALVERLGRQYGERWGSSKPETSAFQGDWALSLPSFSPFAAHAAIKDLWIHAADSSVEAFVSLATEFRRLGFSGASLKLYWADPDGLPEPARWGQVSVLLRPDSGGVGIDMEFTPHWDPPERLRSIVEAGNLPIEVTPMQGKTHLRHRQDPGLLYTPQSDVIRPMKWVCLFRAESLQGLLARAARMLDCAADGPRQIVWVLSAHARGEADDAKRLALWELIATGQFPAREYGVMLDLALTDLATLDVLRSLPGRWSIHYWLGTVDRRDEDGMPLGEDDDPMAPRYIRFGIETSRAGHRLLLESDAPFDLAALAALTGLSFQKWR
ncbi:MAG: hypothetical protein HUU35_04365 [Armatimonadetes bacterium]|nr:hypothetical protein [Armatimonadota bacterium]